MPFAALSASTCAAALACYAASTAGWNQKERSMMPTSLSTVCGLRDASDVHEEVAPPHLLEDLHQRCSRGGRDASGAGRIDPQLVMTEPRRWSRSWAWSWV